MKVLKCINFVNNKLICNVMHQYLFQCSYHLVQAVVKIPRPFELIYLLI